jgi:hypothetical protein
VVDAILNLSVHESGEVINGVVDAMVRDAPLWIVVGANFGGAIACRDEALTSRRDVVDVFLMLAVVDIGAQST